MPNWIKTTGKWGAIVLGLFLFLGLGFVAYFPEMSNEIAYQADNKWGSIFVVIALIITLLKQIISFIGFLTFIIKIAVVLFFVAIFLGIGVMILRTWKSNQASTE